MSKHYEKVSEHTDKLIADIMAKYHAPLTAAGVRIYASFVTQLDKHGERSSCLKCRGASALAMIKVPSADSKMHCDRDLDMIIDSVCWDSLNEAHQAALIDHELEHIELKIDNKTGKVKTDPSTGRPKFRLKPDDFALTGFFSVIRRHKKDANEMVSVSRVHSAALAHLNGSDES